MKNTKIKVLSVLLTLALTLAVITPLCIIFASAEGTNETEPSAVGDFFAVNGIKYKIRTLPGQTADSPPRPINGTVELVRPMIDETEYPENTDLVLPSIVTNEKGELFYVVSIADGAFENYENIRSVDMSETSIAQIGDNAFSRCRDLKTVYFAMGGIIDEIGDYAFYECDLSSIYINTWLLYEVGRYSFANNENLKYAIISGGGEDGGSFGDNVFFGAATGFKLYTDSDWIESKFSSQVTVEKGDDITYNTFRLRESYVSTGSEFVYNAKPIAEPKVAIYYESVTGESLKRTFIGERGYSVTYRRDGKLTEDFTSAGVITVVVSFDPTASANYAKFLGDLFFEVTILPAELTVIARDKSIDDGQSTVGGAEDIICYGLAEGDSLSAVTLSASGNSLVPSKVIVKNSENIDVTANYNITYANGRSFTEKSIESFTKTTEGNVDTYTIVFGDGTTETVVITNGVDGKDGQDGATGVAGPQGEKGDAGATGADESNGTSTLVYVSIGIGGVGLILGAVALIIGLRKSKIPPKPSNPPQSGKSEENSENEE